jgi:saccharopine dehydrogenase-like NADP-dependent oxidoreductase
MLFVKGDMMKKILVVGAGGQGGPCASVLSRAEDVSEIRLGDINVELAQNVADKIGSRKVKPLKLDASRREDISDAAADVEAIINLTLIDFNDTILAAALEASCHYIDTACDYSYLRHLVEGAPLKFDDEFKKLGKTALMGCGATPGMSNVLIRYLCDQLDKIDKIYLRCGYAEFGEPAEVVSAWDPGWSPEIALADFAELPMIFENGQYKTVPIFSRAENYQFPEPFSRILIASHSHEEPYTLPYYIGKDVQEVDFKYPVDPLAGAFVKMGFADDNEIDVKGVKVVPRDVLMKLVPRPANTFLSETEASIDASRDFGWIMEITVNGSKNGEERSHCLTDLTILDKDTKRNLYRTFGTSHIGVALPAVAGARMCLQGDTGSGVISSECLDPAIFFKKMAAMGLPLAFEEKITKQLSF